MIDRRTFLGSTAALALATGLPTALPNVALAAPEGFDNPPLPEKTIGSPDAPVTLTEYASMTCGHCRAFHKEVWPTIKEEYVDTGKVRFRLREFAFDPLAAAGFMLARCAPNDGYFAMVDVLFDRQSQWRNAQNPAQELFNISKLAGFTRENFETCLKDQALLNKINASFEQGKTFGVTGTPTLFVNGEKVEGGYGLDNVRKALDAKLPS